MQIDVLAEKLGWKLLTESSGADREALGCYCGDLLSWVMGRAKADDVWLTVMGNINAIAVATLADVSAIVLVEDAALDAEALARDARVLDLTESPVFRERFVEEMIFGSPEG